MKSTKFVPMIVVVASLALFACAGLGFSLGAPASAAPSNPSNSSVPSVPQASLPALVSPQPVPDVAGLQNAYEAVYQKVNPSVVTIEISSRVLTNGGSGQGQVVPTAEGSGVIWDTSGRIVTNNHVVDGAVKMTVTFSDGSSYDAKLVGTDPNTDLAVIQVTGAPAALLKPITVGDSAQVKVGQIVVAVGNPFGLANTMTTGIVSAIGRSIDSAPNNAQSNAPNFSIPDVIQTDAAINPGNSGGALVDMSGTLIGIPSQIETQSGSNSGVGFAIPSAIVNNVAAQLISKGAASHSYLGISGIAVTPDVISAINLKAGQQGILVANVIAGGPSASAGLQPAAVDKNGVPTAAGDIITAINGKPITRFEDLVSYLYDQTQPGQTVTLDVLRNGQQIQVRVTLGTQPTH